MCLKFPEEICYFDILNFHVFCLPGSYMGQLALEVNESVRQHDWQLSPAWYWAWAGTQYSSSAGVRNRKGTTTVFHAKYWLCPELSFIECVLACCFIARYFSLPVVNKNELSKTVNTSNQIACQQQHSMSLLCETRAAGKGRAILNDVSHPLSVPSG